MSVSWGNENLEDEDAMMVNAVDSVDAADTRATESIDDYPKRMAVVFDGAVGEGLCSSVGMAQRWSLLFKRRAT